VVDAVVVGSGPNGLAAALTLARAGLEVRVIEGSEAPGGGCRTEELTLPGFRHDVCSAVHPLAAASPFLRGLDLPLLQPEVALAHPLDGGRAAAVVRSVEATAAGLGADGVLYRRLFGGLTGRAGPIVDAMLRPQRSVPNPAATAFGVMGLLPASWLRRAFRTDEGRAILGGTAAHSFRPLDAPLTGAFGLLLTTLAHSAGWPVVEGGSVGIVDALLAELSERGGTVETGHWVERLEDLPPARLTLLDVSVASPLVPGRNRRFRFGPGVCKVDWALAGPVPWAAGACRCTCTVHVGGTFDEIRRCEAEVTAGRHPERPFCIVAQPAVVDPSRGEVLWGYCHVPAGSTVDMTQRIEAQIERFAPGFRDLVLARATRTAAEMERHNPNYVGGDINGGAATVRQTVFRPSFRWNPYRTATRGVYLCSASTPPGGGVHGMCGVGAAEAALRDLRNG
jgi:phytoene dehydrogenase-like protein